MASSSSGGRGRKATASGKKSSPKKRAKAVTSYQKPAAGKQGKAAGTKTPAKAPAGPPSRLMEDMTTSQKVVWISLHALVFLVPLAMSNMNYLAGAIPFFRIPLTYDMFDIVKLFTMRACALIGLGAWLFDFFLRGGKVRRTKADWLLLIFIAWALLTSFTSIHPPTAFFGKYRRFEGFWSYLTYAVVFFLTVQMADRPARIRSLAHTLVVSGGLVAFYGILQYLNLDPIKWGSGVSFEATRSFSTYGNPDLLGGFLLFPVPISLAIALSDRRPLWRGVYWGVFLLASAAWITAFTRGAWIGGIVALAVMAVMAFLAPVEWGAIDWTGTGVVGTAAAAIVARSLTSSNETLNVWARVTSIFKFGEGSAQSRFEMWKSAATAIGRRPILGWGADTWRLVFPMFKTGKYTAIAGQISVSDNAHNYPLQLAMAIGIPGALLTYGLFAWILFLGVPNAFARGKGPDRYIITGFWAAAIGYITHLMFGLSLPGATVLLWLCLAIVVAPTARTVEMAPRAWGPAAAVVSAALVVAASVYNITYLVADRYYLESLFAAELGVDPVEKAKVAVRLNPSNDMYRTQVALAYNDEMLASLRQALTEQSQGQDPTASVTAAEGSFRMAEQAYLDILEFVPTEFDNYKFLAGMYIQAAPYFGAENYEKAIKIADRGIEVEPYGPYVRWQKAVALMDLGRLDEAIKVLEAAVPMDMNYTDPMALLADAYLKTGEYRKAEPLYARVLEFHPDDEQSRRNLAKVYVGIGDYVTALKQYRILAKSAPEDTTITDAIRSLEATLAAAGGTKN